MSLPTWAFEGDVGLQCVGLVLASAVGVLLYYLPLRILQQQRNTRALMLLEPNAKAASAGLMLYSCFGMLQPHLPSGLRTCLGAPPSSGVLCFLGGAAIGSGLVFHISRHYGDASPNAANAAVLAHGIAEGAGLGLLVGSPGFDAVFRGQVLHGVPDGALVAMVSLGRYGLLRAMRTALFARLAQAAAYYAAAVYLPPVPEDVAQIAEGVALGSMAAMVWEELAKPARDALGGKTAILIIAAAAGASAAAC
ncbi:hypothetical protein TraAM80_01664 [Trypanosoma rangeli]|uniref:Zinc transporter n=1 Tax=Trypanosoma rangeli TaxID=5698 RepID=A0A3R7NQW8_TRYRA|nr:uncharacterized protein TraAM80_01664 [Trypanosoma rangeli]RNF10225.1 hypothetical protein TraAM80_01664 [Trypanosoma rangeli]|eukprot:RNF10225.1 hypothetical protein TraAM80_01664 [Trypanosoma rangeli]